MDQQNLDTKQLALKPLLLALFIKIDMGLGKRNGALLGA
jgi:hypothetical protein